MDAVDRLYGDLKALECRANRIPYEEAMRDEALFSSIQERVFAGAKEVCDSLDQSEWDAGGRAFRSHPIHSDLVMKAPFAWRAFTKPSGYAGDKDMMLMILRNEDAGESNFARLMNRLYQTWPGAVRVTTRVAGMQGLLETLPSGARVLNIACGPAEEVRRLLDGSPDRDIAFDLVDHDLNTLRYVRRTIRKRQAAPVVGNAYRFMKGDFRVVCPRAGIEPLCDPRVDFKGGRRLMAPLKYRSRALREGSYDLIYSMGLYDYIEDDRLDGKGRRVGVRSLTGQLFRLLKPGGRLIVGNYLLPSDSTPHKNHHRLMFEWSFDWKLQYRTPRQIETFLEDIPGEFEWRITGEFFDEREHLAGCAIGFLEIRRT